MIAQRAFVVFSNALFAVMLHAGDHPLFSGDGTPQPGSFHTEVSSSADVGKAPDGQSSIQWTFKSDGATPYGNALILKDVFRDWSDNDELILEIYTEKPQIGRVGLQLVANGVETSLSDVNPRTVRGKWLRSGMQEDRLETLKGGIWQEVRIPIRERDLREVTEVRIFCDGRQFPKGEHIFYLRGLRLGDRERPAGVTIERDMEKGKVMAKYSDLSVAQQEAVRQFTAPPPLSERSNPYSTFMCYPMWSVKGSDGKPLLGSSPDGKFHPEWQEALVKSWADLGITQLHFYAWPSGCGTPVRDYSIDGESRRGLENFAALCANYGIKIGLRVDPPYDLEKPENLPPNQDPTGDYWAANPRNPNNELNQFFAWLVDLLKTMRGRVEYVVLGDEIDPSRKVRSDGRSWTLEDFMAYTRQGAAAIHKVYPQIKVSLPSFGAGSWPEIVEMLKMDYASFADAVAINNDNYRIASTFMADLKKYSPNKKLVLLSNGVGYISSDTKDRNPPFDVYRKYTENDQAAMIARSMYFWWEIGSYVAPYYVALRNIVYEGKKQPLWYGFFGFMDLDIDSRGAARTIHYPAWSAFQTIANIFHDRAQFKEPEFKVESSNENTLHLKAYERAGRELTIIVWGENVPGQTTEILVPSLKYRYPVSIDLLDGHKWVDTPSIQITKGVVLQKVPLGITPTIIRMISEDVVKVQNR